MVSSLVALSTTNSRGFELGRLVDDEFPRRHLAAIVQPAGDFEFVPFLLAQVKIGERPVLGDVGRARQHIGRLGDAVTVPAGIGRLGVDRAGEHLEHGAEQVALCVDQHLVVERHRGLTGERLDQRHDFRRERYRLPVASSRVDQLQDSDHLGVMVLQRHGQKGLRAIAGPLIEGARPAEIETRHVIGVGDVDRVAGDRGGGDDVAVVRAAIRLAQLHRGKRDRRRGGAAQSDLHRVVAHDDEAQLAAILADEVERPAIGVGQLLGAEQDLLQQPVVIALDRQRDAELDQPPIAEFPVLDRRTRRHSPSSADRGGPKCRCRRGPPHNPPNVL